MTRFQHLSAILLLSTAFLILATTAHASVWVSGSNTINQPGVYGAKGTPDPNNIPGSRYESIAWTDENDNLWLFGGYGYDEAGTDDFLNDLWKFDGNDWTWISGANNVNQSGIYGTQGLSHPNNVPGARYGSHSVIDSFGDLCLFGGYGYDVTGSKGVLSDLWKFSTNTGQWIWISGPNTIRHEGSYGTIGVPHPNNLPRSRENGAIWIDPNDNLWLFGGSGEFFGGKVGWMSTWLNDLWKFDPHSGLWTWVSGSNTTGQPGVYGEKGIPAPSNVPGARSGTAFWIDNANNLWLFAGSRSDSGFNDLWKFDPIISQWTWIDGSNLIGQYGVYGEKGVADPCNIPGTRRYLVSFKNALCDFYLFGGYGLASSDSGRLNDFWKFDGTDWTWLGGSDIADQSGIYGTQGVNDPNNFPGSRSYSIAWTTSDNKFYIFGGYGKDADENNGVLNDLWRLTGFCTYYSPGDINRDCRVDFLDLAVLAQDWAKNYWVE